ncbi:uncharacterized protein LOC114876079 isoform X3 [Osmia bicornis bicornis]|uniref:uncharacterized protein LOC114876079 isoform X3 n=1 Tax=Osmia bicornis bicornis TaxID=1437191 RepID=UPI0010F65BF6|nr:uncharacterized protein LOC114876079 isoform X3 [Osmia bicornis bicornis]
MILGASEISRSWLEAANSEKRTRGPICLIKSCTSSNEEVDEEYVKVEIFKKLRIKPALGLFFTPPLSRFRKKDCHCNILPSNCHTVTLTTTYGIVINDKEMQENVENILGVFLPDLPNVTVKTVTFIDNILFKINGISESKKKYIEEIKSVLDTAGKDTNTSKCLLLFCDRSQGRSSAIEIANSLKKCYKEDELSVWGGVVRCGFVCNSKETPNDQCTQFAFCTAVALVGPIDTWSLIVDRNHNTKEKVEQRLKLFRNRICLKKHSIGLMFACCARGENMFQECNVESSIFKKLFPKVPLAGCFGDGEFGTNRIPNEPSNNKRTRWYNEMSTVFLIITYDD